MVFSSRILLDLLTTLTIREQGRLPSDYRVWRYPSRTGPARGKDNRWMFCYILESHDSTSGKRVIWNRTGNCPTRGANVKHPGIFWWCQKWPYKMIWVVTDRKGGGWVMAVAPSIWLFFPSLSFSRGDPFSVMRILPVHWAACRPWWAGFFWALWVRSSLMSWFISVAISGYRTWMRKDL